MLSQVNRTKSKKLKISLISILLISITICTTFIYNECSSFVFPDKIQDEIEETTALNNKYNKTKRGTQVENGHWVNLYICKKELDSCWKSLTDTSIFAIDNKSPYNFYSICRYMTSKNLRKDAEGFSQLTDNDIENIRLGFTNYRFTTNFAPQKRIYDVCWEIFNYVHGGNPDGHSITQRCEFIKCALVTIKNAPFVGFGIHTEQAMYNSYAVAPVHINPEHWCLPHNQLLLIGVITGIIGLIIFIICCLGIILFSRNKWNALTISWFIITAISFISEDTLNTLAGIAFVAFVGSLVLFSQPNNTNKL